MAEEFKICLAGTNTKPVEGTEHFKLMEDIELWLAEHQVYYAENDPEKPVDDGSKYVVLPIDM
jgi:hypothetical protein